MLQRERALPQTLHIHADLNERVHRSVKKLWGQPQGSRICHGTLVIHEMKRRRRFAMPAAYAQSQPAREISTTLDATGRRYV